MKIEMGDWITKPVITMWVIVAVLALLSWLATRNLKKDEPGKLQNIAEMAVEKLQNFFAGIMGEKELGHFEDSEKSLRDRERELTNWLMEQGW